MPLLIIKYIFCVNYMDCFCDFSVDHNSVVNSEMSILRTKKRIHD